MKSSKHSTGFSTRAIHAGQSPDPTTGAVMQPIYATSTFKQSSPGVHTGFEYARTQNPTRMAFEGCIAELPGLCTILKTYLKTLKLCLLTWVLTLLIGFTVAYFLAFHVRSKTWQIVLSLLCTIPFWTSNVIRMIAWIPLLGRNGLVNKGLEGIGLIQQPVEWLLFSEFSVVLALVHLFTFFMVVPIFNSMIRIDKRLIEAAYDAGATGWQTLVNIIIPLAKPGIVIGSIFVITIVMGDFVTIGVMGGQQIASAGKIIESRLSALQFPAAAANAVILLGITILIISSLTRIVDIRKEL